MTRPITEEVIDAIGLLVREYQEPEDEARRTDARKRMARALKHLEDAAFKRGYQARQDELTANLRRVAEVWKRPGL